MGGGSSIYLWLDFWHPDGILYDQYGYIIFYDARNKLDVKLSSISKGKERGWLPARSESLINIQGKLPLVKLGVNYKPLWMVSKSNSYTSRETWEAIREKQPRVEWWKLIWLSMAIPKHAFCIVAGGKELILNRR